MYLMRLIYLIFLSLIFCFNSALVQAEDSERKLTTCELFEQAILERNLDEFFYPFEEKRNDVGISRDFKTTMHLKLAPSNTLLRGENTWAKIRR